MNRQDRRKLIKELDDISKTLIINYKDENTFLTKEHFQRAKEKIIRWAIINAHAYIDYLITLKINNIIFKRKSKNLKKILESNELIKKINHGLIYEITFIKRAELIKNITPLKDSLFKKITKINNIRNNIAHLYTFDISSKEKQYWNKILKYENNDIMSNDWITIFMRDVDDIIDNISNF